MDAKGQVESVMPHNQTSEKTKTERLRTVRILFAAILAVFLISVVSMTVWLIRRDTPAKAVRRAMKQISALDESAISAVASPGSAGHISEETVSALRRFFDGFSCKVLSSSREEDQAAVRIRVTTPDARSLAQDIRLCLLKNTEQELSSADQIYPFLDRFLSERKYPLSDTEGTVSLTRTQEGWTIRQDSQLSSLLLGGLPEALLDPYLLTPEQYRAMRFGMAQFMKPDAHPRYSIGNIYYDTENYDLIRASLEKPVYKEKLRMRSYGVPGSRDSVFVEIKKKYDDVVYKRRVTMEMMSAERYLRGAQGGDGSQISREIAYAREAYAAADGGELRITFDTALRARSNDLDLRLGDHGVPLLSDDRILMEIKIPGVSPLWLARLLSENRIFPTSFSKYGEYYKQFVLGGKSAEVQKEVILSA